MWTAMGKLRDELAADYHKPLFVLMEAAYPEDEEDLTDWRGSWQKARGQVRNTDVQVCTSWGRLVRLDGSTQIVNLAGVAPACTPGRA